MSFRVVPYSTALGLVVEGAGSFNKVLRRLLMTRAHLNPLVAAQVVSDPPLSALVFAADPIAEDLSVVGIALPLNTFKVHELAADTARDWGIGRDAFGAYIQLGKAGHMGEIEAGPP
jgi:hypothetical protein